MKTLIIIATVAALAMPGAAQAGGLFGNGGYGGKSGSLLSGVTSAVVGLTTRDINVLNGNTVAVGNNSSILSGIGSGNSLLSGILSGNRSSTSQSGGKHR
ncbi:hypothetical protein SAMN02983003_1374 [Devosia enhydra]|uniref:Uncharacterized protein n=1 Tax=Devosia enhydra TaxID=665118 RepID=A0A1K2HVT5_9HYPH|nr:hypothetical protein [Devosia enhydra]SFZ82957.1 hypothetical protein SAMN02983003_1374 [Devosia enhydra]